MYAYLVALAFAAAIGFRDTLWDLPYSLPIIALLSVSIALVGRHWRSLSEMPVSTYALLAATALPYLTLLWSAWKPMTLWISLPLATAPAVILVGKEILGESDKWQTARRLVRLTGFAFSGFVLFDYFLTARRSDGLWHDANAAAALINALLIPYLITFITDTKSNKARTSPAIAILLLSAALFSTFSRGATLSFTISLAGFFVLAFVFRIPLTWRNAVASLAAVALGYTIVAALGPETGIERLTRDIGSDNSVKARLLMWESTLELYRQAPLAGHGIGSYKLLYPSVRSPEETQSSGDFAHNDYAQLLAEGGPFLAAMPIALGIWLSLRVLRLARGSQKSPDRQSTPSTEDLERIGLYFGVTAILIHAFFNFIIYVSAIAIIVAIFTARILSSEKIEKTAAKNDKIILNRNKVWNLSAIVGGSFGLAMTTALATEILSVYWFSPEKLKQEDYNLRGDLSGRALALRYLNPLSQWPRLFLIRAETNTAAQLADSPMGAGLAELALRDIEELLEIKRVDCTAQTIQAGLIRHFGEALAFEGTKSDPEKLLMQAIRDNPICTAPYMDLASIYAERGQLEESIQVLEDAVDWLHIPGPHKSIRVRVIAKLSNLYLQAGRDKDAALSAHFVLANDPDNALALETLRKLDEGK